MIDGKLNLSNPDDDREQFLAQEMAPPGMPSSDFLLKYVMPRIL